MQAKSYVDRRKDKTAKIRKRYRPKKLNRWLSRRMFRGANKVMWARKEIIEALPIENPIRFRGIDLFRYTPEDITHSVPGVNGPTFTPALAAKKKTMPVSELREIIRSYSSEVA